MNEAFTGPYFYRKQTVAVLEVCHQTSGNLDFHVGAQTDLMPDQSQLAEKLGLIPHVLKGEHAEPTAVKGAQGSASPSDPLEPIAIFSTNIFCGEDRSDCRGYLVQQGASIVDGRHAVWKTLPPRVWRGLLD